jgi:hypothetical protein
MTDANIIADRYIAIWNEADTERRRALIADAWTEDCSYVDPMMRADNREQIHALVTAAHERFPGFRFTLITEGEPLVKGTDFAILEGERLKSVHGFIDQLPAAA